MTERPRKATRLTVSLEEQDYRSSTRSHWLVTLPFPGSFARLFGNSSKPRLARRAKLGHLMVAGRAASDDRHRVSRQVLCL